MTYSSRTTGRFARTAPWAVVLGAVVSGCSPAPTPPTPRAPATPATPAGPASASSPSTPGTSHTVRLEQIRLPHQGVTDASDELSDWVSAPWSYQPCGRDGELLAVDSGAQVRSIEQTGPEYHAVETAALFVDEAAALAFVRRIEAAVAACDTPGPTVDTLTVAGNVPGAWTQGRVYATSYRLYGLEGPQSTPTATVPEGWMGGHYLLLARTGPVVLMVQRAGEFGPSYPAPLPDLVAQFRPPLDELVRQVE